VAANHAMVVMRTEALADVPRKEPVGLDALADEVRARLDRFQNALLAAARARREDHSHRGVDSLDALRRAKLDIEAFAAYQPGTDFFEPFLCVTEGYTAAGDTAARLLLPPPMPAEDPFTGSATGCMGCYLWAKGLIENSRFTAEQGHGMGRPGRAEVEVLGRRDTITGVKVGGSGVVLMEGMVRL